MNNLEEISKKYSEMFGIELTPVILKIITTEYNCSLMKNLINKSDYDTAVKVGNLIKEVWIKTPKKQNDENSI